MKFTLYALVLLALIGLVFAKPAEEAEEKIDSAPKETEKKVEDKPANAANDATDKDAKAEAPKPNLVRDMVAFPVTLLRGGAKLAESVVDGFTNGIKGQKGENA
ncbi:uncharacterized protein LOC126366098 isoform X5 [Pectinophora gossypiella]|uniref:uncharacterized protein LOC126366098 isoform X5 n=1 Tax=Pectinophora gossypiella TaxID=13191 RepID=UPI00214ECE0A|nr:uncharacterized protein LOC126366098 isoform X5 [Pectinophora gossypiella]